MAEATHRSVDGDEGAVLLLMVTLLLICLVGCISIWFQCCRLSREWKKRREKTKQQRYITAAEDLQSTKDLFQRQTNESRDLQQEIQALSTMQHDVASQLVELKKVVDLMHAQRAHQEQQQKQQDDVYYSDEEQERNDDEHQQNELFEVDQSKKDR